MTRLQVVLLGITPASALLAVYFGVPRLPVSLVGLILVVLIVNGVFDKIVDWRPEDVNQVEEPPPQSGAVDKKTQPW